MAAEPIFFASPQELRDWFDRYAARETELWVGYHRTSTGRPSLTWAQSVDEALSVGWIDGIRKSIDDGRYMIRFTPRKARSTWSAVNIRRVGELTAAGRMRPAGLAAFERRSDDRSAIYAYEQRHNAELAPEELAQLQADAAARAFWERQPAGYRHTAAYWISSAKRPETRARRVAQLIEDSAAGRRIGTLSGRARGGAPG